MDGWPNINAPKGGSTSSRSGASSLPAPGSVVMACVDEDLGDGKYALRWGQNRIAVNSQSPLRPGQSLILRSEMSPEGKITLVVQGPAIPDPGSITGRVIYGPGKHPGAGQGAGQTVEEELPQQPRAYGPANKQGQDVGSQMAAGVSRAVTAQPPPAAQSLVGLVLEPLPDLQASVAALEEVLEEEKKHLEGGGEKKEQPGKTAGRGEARDGEAAEVVDAGGGKRRPLIRPVDPEAVQAGRQGPAHQPGQTLPSAPAGRGGQPAGGQTTGGQTVSAPAPPQKPPSSSPGTPPVNLTDAGPGVPDDSETPPARPSSGQPPPAESRPDAPQPRPAENQRPAAPQPQPASPPAPSPPPASPQGIPTQSAPAQPASPSTPAPAEPPAAPAQQPQAPVYAFPRQHNPYAKPAQPATPQPQPAVIQGQGAGPAVPDAPVSPAPSVPAEPAAPPPANRAGETPPPPSRPASPPGQPPPSPAEPATTDIPREAFQKEALTQMAKAAELPLSENADSRVLGTPGRIPDAVVDKAATILLRAAGLTPDAAALEAARALVRNNVQIDRETVQALIAMAAGAPDSERDAAIKAAARLAAKDIPIAQPLVSGLADVMERTAGAGELLRRTIAALTAPDGAPPEAEMLMRGARELLEMLHVDLDQADAAQALERYVSTFGRATLGKAMALVEVSTQAALEGNPALQDIDKAIGRILTLLDNDIGRHERLQESATNGTGHKEPAGQTGQTAAAGEAGEPEPPGQSGQSGQPTATRPERPAQAIPGESVPARPAQPDHPPQSPQSPQPPQPPQPLPGPLAMPAGAIPETEAPGPVLSPLPPQAAVPPRRPINAYLNAPRALPIADMLKNLPPMPRLVSINDPVPQQTPQNPLPQPVPQPAAMPGETGPVAPQPAPQPGQQQPVPPTPMPAPLPQQPQQPIAAGGREGAPPPQTQQPPLPQPIPPQPGQPIDAGIRDGAPPAPPARPQGQPAPRQSQQQPHHTPPLWQPSRPPVDAGVREGVPPERQAVREAMMRAALPERQGGALLLKLDSLFQTPGLNRAEFELLKPNGFLERYLNSASQGPNGASVKQEAERLFRELTSQNREGVEKALRELGEKEPEVLRETAARLSRREGEIMRGDPLLNKLADAAAGLRDMGRQALAVKAENVAGQEREPGVMLAEVPFKLNDDAGDGRMQMFYRRGKGKREGWSSRVILDLNTTRMGPVLGDMRFFGQEMVLNVFVESGEVAAYLESGAERLLDGLWGKGFSVKARFMVLPAAAGDAAPRLRAERPEIAGEVVEGEDGGAHRLDVKG